MGRCNSEAAHLYKNRCLSEKIKVLSLEVKRLRELISCMPSTYLSVPRSRHIYFASLFRVLQSPATSPTSMYLVDTLRSAFRAPLAHFGLDLGQKPTKIPSRALGLKKRKNPFCSIGLENVCTQMLLKLKQVRAIRPENAGDRAIMSRVTTSWKDLPHFLWLLCYISE